jgi:hypothetical protein
MIEHGFFILFLERLFLVLIQVGVIWGILYLLWRYRWKPWIEEGKRRYEERR